MAYEVLKDKQKRDLYNQFGEEGLNGHSSGSGGGGTSNFSTGNIDPHEIFNMMFGNNDFGFGGMPSGFSTSFSSSNSGSPGSFSHSSSFDNGTQPGFGFGGFNNGFGSSRGGGFNQTFGHGQPNQKVNKGKVDKIEVDLNLTLEELYNGCTKRRKISRQRKRGNGIYEKQENILTIDVKKGWKEGTKITFNGEGDEREGYSAGDVIFVLKEKKHSQYRREGNDLVFSCEVSLYEALTGGQLCIPLLNGVNYTYNYPALSSSSNRMKISGLGMPISKSPTQKGDLYVKFEVLLPSHLSTDQKELLNDVMQ